MFCRLQNFDINKNIKYTLITTVKTYTNCEIIEFSHDELSIIISTFDDKKVFICCDKIVAIEEL